MTRQQDLDISATLLDALTAHIAVIKPNGQITTTNDAWDSFVGKGIEIKRPQNGDNYFECLQQAIEYGNDYALKILLGIQGVIQGEKSSYTLTYPLQTESDTYWFKLTAKSCNGGCQYLIMHEDISSSIEAKHQLKESQNRYQIQFEQSLDGILITDTHGTIIDANPAAGQILGYDRRNLIACKRDDIVDISDPNYQQALKERKESGTYQIETNLIHNEGYKIPVEISSRAYRTQAGKLHAIVSFRDISQRKEAENKLVKNKHFTESALNSIPGVFLVLDRDGNIVRWNEHMITDLGYSAEELSRKNALEFIEDGDRKRIRQKMEECIQDGELAVETQVYSKKGGIKDYFLYAKRFVEDGETYLVGAGIDISESKKNKRENRKSQLKLQQLFDNAPVGITIVDTNDQVIQANESFENMFGFKADEVAGEHINDLIVPPDLKTEAEAITRATQSGKSLQTKTVRQTQCGKKLSVLAGSVPVELNDKIIAIYGIYVDITRQQEYQQKIEEALREKEILLAELHHRVKNNLALINSLLELQLFDTEHPEFTKQLTHIQNRILTIASIHEVLYRQGNLHDIPFSNFLNKFITSSGFQQDSNNKGISINNDTKNVTLDIDQSIPCGLLLNEILSLIFEFTDPDKQNEINIHLRKYQQQIHLIIEGYDMVQCPREVRQHQSLHNILIEPLVNQLGGVLLWPVSDGTTQKFELIFSKEMGNGPGRELLKAKNQ
jgi:PAS domain S-box-containing protein